MKINIERGEILKESKAKDNKKISDIKMKEANKEVIEILKGLENIIIFYIYSERIGLIKGAEGLLTTIQFSI